MKTLVIIALILAALTAALLRSQTLSNITYDAGAQIDIGVSADVCADAIIVNGTYTGGGTICSGPLPVTMLVFTSVVNMNNVTLSWQTAAELNNSGFDIEKKTDKEGENWARISFVQGSGTTNEPRSYNYEDKKLKTGSYKYRLKQIDYNGSSEYFDLEGSVYIKPPASFTVSQNYPNPSNPNSKIDYEIPVPCKVTIKVYNLIGQEVIALVNETKEAGYYTAEFDGAIHASGIYFYRIIVDDNAGNTFTKTLKMILVK